MIVRLALAAMLVMAPAMAADSPKLLTWPDLIKRPRPAADGTIAYGPALEQRVDVWTPAGPGPFPVVLMVHGGCWQSNIADRSLMNWIAADLHSAGIAVWNIDYRGVDRAGGGYPGTFQDAAAAADLLRSKAKQYNLDLDRLVAVGHSAGGHLALWLAARHRIAVTSPLHSARPIAIRHVISLGGLPDLEATGRSPDNGCGTDVVGKLVGSGRADPFADTSVPRLLPLGAEQQLVNGREDRIIPFRFATDYVQHAKASGDHATLHAVPATGHVELIAPETPAWAQARKLIQAALAK